nr:hypothetical protein [Tanacetum cinerariifolium]
MCGRIGPRGDDAQGGDANALVVPDRCGEAVGEGVGDAVEGEEAFVVCLANLGKEGLQRQSLTVREDVILGVDE